MPARQIRSPTRHWPSRSPPLVVLVTLLLLAPLGSPGVGADDSYLEQLAVRITPPIILAAQDVRALITVPRRPENRWLIVIVEGPKYYTSTERQLDGDGAALVHQFAFRHLPEGDYLVQVNVKGSRGSRTEIETRFTVRGAPLDPVLPGARP